jgi:hypothetical protein
MPTTGFHSEWFTYKSHRMLLECRASFPDDHMRFIASVAAETLDHNSGNSSKVVKIYFDDKSGTWTIYFASSNTEDAHLEKALDQIFGLIFSYGNIMSEFCYVPKGNIHSDHYHRMEHLSVGAGVADDRWKHNDQEYKNTVKVPS